MNHKEIQEIVATGIAENSKCRFVIDAVFEEFAREQGHELPSYQKLFHLERIIVVRSLSKEDGYAGVRAGYIHGNKLIIKRVEKKLGNIQSISQSGALALEYSHKEEGKAAKKRTIRSLIDEKKEICRKMKEFVEKEKIGRTTFAIHDTAASFLIVSIKEEMRKAMGNYLRRCWNMDVNWITRFDDTRTRILKEPKADITGRAIEGLVRISPGNRSENEKLCVALQSFLGQSWVRG